MGSRTCVDISDFVWRTEAALADPAQAAVPILTIATFVTERDDLPCRYGLVTPLRSNNPIVIALHEWAALGRDPWRAQTWRERLACLIGPPAGGPAATVAPSAPRDPDRAVSTATAG